MHRALRCRAALWPNGSTRIVISHLSTVASNSSPSVEAPSRIVTQTPSSVQASGSSESQKWLEATVSIQSDQATSEGKKLPSKKGKRRRNDLELRPHKDGTYEFIQQEVAQNLNLDDLIKLRPDISEFPDVTGKQYEKVYDTVAKKIDRSFTQRQLFQLLRKMGPGPGSAAVAGEGAVASSPPVVVDKRDAIRRILNHHWAMPEPVLLDVKGEKKDPKNITHSVPISSEQLFLLFGKDGANMLKVSRIYKVGIRPVSQESPTASLSLSIRGEPQDVQAMKSHLRQRFKGVRTNVVEPLVPGAVGPDLAQVISRVSGAYFNTDDPQKLLVTTGERSSYHAALRLTNRACFQNLSSTQVPLLVHSPPSESDRASSALYPYLSSEPLPWTLGRSSVFRVRRVGGWQKLDSQNSSTTQEACASSLSGFGKFTTSGDKELHLKDVLLGPLPPLPPSHKRSVSARTGHIVFPRVGSSERTTFTPVIPGAHATTQLIQRLTEEEECGPRSFIRRSFHFPNVQQAVPQNTLVVEYTLPARVAQRTSESESGSTSVELRCWIGDETRVDVAFPERPLDMLFTAYDHVEISSNDIPPRLKRSMSILEQTVRKGGSNLLPLSGVALITWNDAEFHLDRCESVQSQPPSMASGITSANELSMVTTVTEVCEDLDSRVKTSCTVITSTDIDNASTVGWAAFMQECDDASSRPYARPQARRNPFIRYTELDVD
ncbi:hypothetical protein FRB97_001292 [Tulasnella sp. 331]|nr:hypothetical protein FRB97_001292 [Tulasnella sp. 331]